MWDVHTQHGEKNKSRRRSLHKCHNSLIPNSCDFQKFKRENKLKNKAAGAAVRRKICPSQLWQWLFRVRYLSSPTPGMSSFSSAVWKMQEVLESRDDSKTQEFSESTDIFSHICRGAGESDGSANSLNTKRQVFHKRSCFYILENFKSAKWRGVLKNKYNSE